MSELKKSTKIILGITIPAILLGGAYGIYKVVNNYLDNSLNEYNKASDEEKEKSDKIKDYIKNKEDGKDPNDIVITEDLTKEEKEDLMGEKLYLQINASAKNLFYENHTEYSDSNDSYSTQYFFDEVENVKVSDNQLIIKCRYFRVFGKLFKEESLNMVVDLDNNLSTLEEVNQFLQNSDIKYKETILNKKQDQEVFDIFEQYISNRFQELYSISDFKIVDANFDSYINPPSKINIFATGSENGEQKSYYLDTLISTTAFDYEEFVDFVKKGDFGLNCKKVDLKNLDYDWIELHDKYSNSVNLEENQQTAQEQAMTAAEEFTTTDANGEQGFDWNAYQQDQANKAQQTLTPKDTTSPVIYNDLTL